MAYAIGTITNSGGVSCHKQMLGIIESLALANGWVTLRKLTTGNNYELILKGSGLSGNEEIFVGFQTYESVAADYYNINLMTSVGYVPENAFNNQPGAQYYALAAHNNAMTYYLVCNAQRIAMCLKIGTPVYHHAYVGKYFPYARPGELPLPLMCAGMFDYNAATRFDKGASFPYFGSNTSFSRIRDQTGAWVSTYNHPYSQGGGLTTGLAGTQGQSTLVPASNYYQVEPIILVDFVSNVINKNVWGELDGIKFCSGFSNATENVIQNGGTSEVDQTGKTPSQAVSAIEAVGGVASVMLQSNRANSWRDFIAMEMK